MPPVDPKPADVRAKKDPKEKPDKAEHDGLKAALKAAGLDDARIEQAVGKNPGAKSRAENVQALIALCRSFPKKK